MGEIMKEMSQTMQILPLPIYRKLQLKGHISKFLNQRGGGHNQLKLTDEERIIEITNVVRSSSFRLQL
jgi:hypothetical protein